MKRIGIAAVAAGAILMSGCVKPKPLPIMGEIPHFELTSSSGQPFDSRALAGKIWVADFVYTTCTGPCPMMSAQMRQVQDRTAPEMSDVRLVSFTVDPDHDTPPVLETYSHHFKCNPERWFFLTGTKDKLSDVGMAFKLQTIDGSLTHSTRFALVDRQMRIRGYYTTGEDAFMSQLLHDIRQLESGKS